MKSVNTFAILLSSHDDVCCRSNSIRNLLLLYKVSKIITNSKIDIFVHPGEFTFLYRMFCIRLFDSCKLNFYRRANHLDKYHTVFSVFSSALIGLNIKQLYIYDPTLKDNYILKIFINAKIL